MEKLGGALKRAVEDKPPDAEEEFKKRKEASVLINDTRRNIFQILCNYPGITVARLMTDLSVSRPTVTWHLRVLEEFMHVSRVA